MEFDVFITQELDACWRAVVPVLPNCSVAGTTREEAIARITACLTENFSHGEVLRLSIPGSNGQPNVSATNTGDTAPAQEWPGYGSFRDDPAWGEIFDEIERRRDEHTVGA